MTEMNKERLLEFKRSYLNVGDLKKYINDNQLSDDTLIVVEIVEDKYFNGGVDISGTPTMIDGKRGVMPEGSRSGEWSVYYKNGEYDRKVPYHPIWSPVKYSDDKDVLFLDLHY